MKRDSGAPSAMQEFKKGLRETPKGKKFAFLVEYVKSHEDLRQFVMFSLFSLLCFAAEMATFYSVYYICDAAGFNLPFKWFVFDYSAAESGGRGGFLAFLLSTTVAQALTFVLNR